jgi:hypothetical protein
MTRIQYAQLGAKYPVVYPCDEADGRRTWDVFYRGDVIAQGFVLRREAAAFARAHPSHPRRVQHPESRT